MRNLRAAVIGAGFVGRAHIEALRRLGVPVQGVLGSSADRARESASSLGLDRAYLSLKELAQDSSVDAVHICTPNYLHFEGALHGVVTVSQVSPGRKARLWFEVDGSEGSLAWNSESPNTLWIGHRDEPNRDMIKDPALMSPAARGFAAYPGGHTEGYPDTFVQLFKEFYGYISAGKLTTPRPFPTFETGHDEMVLCDAISASAQEHRWVKVGKFANAVR